ncbi:hypothetical protein BJ925_2091 [Rahnella aquatilis]|nr:hypothetical protein BJ925_2091 [Rahnella aquatilis]
MNATANVYSGVYRFVFLFYFFKLNQCVASAYRLLLSHHLAFQLIHLKDSGKHACVQRFLNTYQAFLLGWMCRWHIFMPKKTSLLR